jgi:hypothetical protein
MSLLHYEPWDGVTAPAIPSGWNVAGTIVTAVAGPTPISSPNMLTLSTTTVAMKTATWSTADGAGGNVVVQGTAYFQGISFPFGNVSVFGRGSASTLVYASSTFYELNLSLTGGSLNLNAIVAGVSTNVATTAVTVAYGTWYRLTLTLNGSSQTCLLESLSGMTWSTVTSLSGSDASIAAASGYAGWALNQNTIHTNVWGDDWSLSSLATTLHASEAHDTIAASGHFATAAALATIEHHDTVSASGGFLSTGALARTEGHDTFAGSAASVLPAGTIAIAGHGDTFAGSGAFHDPTTLAILERADSLTAWAVVNPRLQIGEHGDTFAASATATGPPGSAGSMAVTGAGDVFAGVAGFSVDTRGTLAILERGDVFAGIASVGSHGAIVAIEGHDSFAGFGGMAASGSIHVVESGDVFRGGFERINYQVFSNAGSGPINYASPIASTAGLTYTTFSLAYPDTWRFGVRAYWVIAGLEEQNLEAACTIVLSAGGADITNLPLPPIGLFAFATAGGSIRVEWTYPGISVAAKKPTGFHVYTAISPALPTYITPAATVPFASSIMGSFVANIGPLTNALTYTIGVRAYNASAEEANTTTVSATADSVGPGAIVGLTAQATI